MKPHRLRKRASNPLSIPAIFLVIPNILWQIYWDQLSLDGVPFLPIWWVIFYLANVLYTPRPDGFRDMVKNTALNAIWTYADFLWIPLGFLGLYRKISEVITARWRHFKLRKSGFEWAYLAIFAAIVLAEVKLDSYPTRVGLLLWGWWWYRDPWEALARHTAFGWIFVWFSYVRLHGWFFIIWELWPFWNRYGNIYWSHPDSSRLPWLRWYWSWERLEVLTRMFNQCALFGTAALFVRMSLYRHNEQIPWPPSVLDAADPRSLQNTIPFYWQYLRTYTRIISPWLFVTCFVLWQFWEGYESRERWGLEGIQFTLEPELGIHILPLAIKIRPRPVSPPESEQRPPDPDTPPKKKVLVIESGTPIVDRTRRPIRDGRAITRIANARQFHDYIQKAHRRMSPPGTWLEFSDKAWAEGVEIEFTAFLSQYVVNYLVAEQVRIDRPLAQKIREFLSNIFEEALDDGGEEVTYVLDEKPDEFRTFMEETGELKSRRCPKAMAKWFQKYKHYPGDEILNKARTSELVRHESLGDKPRIATKTVKVSKNRAHMYDLKGHPITRGEGYWKRLLDFKEIERVKKEEKNNEKDGTGKGRGWRGGRRRANTGVLARSARKPSGFHHGKSEDGSTSRAIQEWLPDFFSREGSVDSREPADANGGYLDDEPFAVDDRTQLETQQPDGDEKAQRPSSFTLSIIIILSMLILWSKIFETEPSVSGQAARPEESRWEPGMEPVLAPAERYSHKLEELLDLPTELDASDTTVDTVKWVEDEKLRKDLEYLENWGERSAEREIVKFEG